jgi:hypothetical protein
VCGKALLFHKVIIVLCGSAAMMSGKPLAFRELNKKQWRLSLQKFGGRVGKAKPFRSSWRRSREEIV